MVFGISFAEEPSKLLYDPRVLSRCPEQFEVRFSLRLILQLGRFFAIIKKLIYRDIESTGELFKCFH